MFSTNLKTTTEPNDRTELVIRQFYGNALVEHYDRFKLVIWHSLRIKKPLVEPNDWVEPQQEQLHFYSCMMSNLLVLI